MMLSMRAVLCAALALSACSEPRSQDTAPDSGVDVPADAPPPIDYDTYIGSGPFWCKINDRAAYGLTSANLDADLRSGAFDWCPHDRNCDDLCGAWIGEGPGSPAVAEYFIACDPASRSVAHPDCTPMP